MMYMNLPVMSLANGGNPWTSEVGEIEVVIEVVIEVEEEVEDEDDVDALSMRDFKTNCLSCASHWALIDFSAKCSVTTHTCPSSD